MERLQKGQIRVWAEFMEKAIIENLDKVRPVKLDENYSFEFVIDSDNKVVAGIFTPIKETNNGH